MRCAPLRLPPQRGTDYDEARAERLRSAQAALAAELARGVAPPVRGTNLFPPGELGGPLGTA